MDADIPKSMKAVLVEEHGGPEVLHYVIDHPVPTPKGHELLVKNELIGVNFIDTYYRTGLYPLPDKPAIIGQESVGTVVAAGDEKEDKGFQVGDRVVWLNFGSYAEYTSVPMDKAIKVPVDVTDKDAVGGFVMGTTTLSLVREAYPVKQGEWVLVHAAAGGVGLLMCQVLRNIGAKTIGTAGGAEKCKLAKAYGAEHVIDYRDPNGPYWVDEVKRLTGNQGVHVVFDSVGKDTWEGSLEATQLKGKVVYYGNASGPVPPFSISMLSAKNLSICRPTLWGYTSTREEFEFYANQFFDQVKSSRMKIRIHEVYKLENVAQAHRDLEGRKTTGKLLLKP